MNIIVPGQERHSIQGVIIGQTAPERQKNGAITTCTAVYSQVHGLVRVYPVPWELRAPMWSEIECEVERNPKDTRKESWKVLGDKLLDGGAFAREHFRLGSVRKFSDDEKLAMLEEIAVGCIKDLNDAFVSMGVVKPRLGSVKVTFRPRGDTSLEDFDADAIMGSGFVTKTDMRRIPYVAFFCERCRTAHGHNISILDKEVLAFLTANRQLSDSEYLSALHKRYFCDVEEWASYFIVGNSYKHRNAFMLGNNVRFKYTQGRSRLHHPYQPKLLVG